MVVNLQRFLSKSDFFLFKNCPQNFTVDMIEIAISQIFNHLMFSVKKISMLGRSQSPSPSFILSEACLFLRATQTEGFPDPYLLSLAMQQTAMPSRVANPLTHAEARQMKEPFDHGPMECY